MAQQDSPASPALQRLGRAYSTLALLVFNLLLAFTCLNVAVLPFLPPQDDSWDLPPYRIGTLKYGFEGLRQVYPDYDDESLVRLLLESANLAHQCDAQLSFTEAPYRGQFVNISPDLFRLIADQVPLQDSTNAYTIFVFGGSTTFGFFEADSKTIPSALQAALRQQALAAQQSIAVFNFGQRGYLSVQEKLFFRRLLERGIKPNLAIFIDGLNDTYYPSVSQRFDCIPAEPLAQALRCPLDGPCLPITRFIESFGRARAEQQAGLPAQPQAADDDFSMMVVQRWLTQRDEIRDLGQSHDVDVLFVRQPVPGFAYDLDYHPFAIDRQNSLFTRAAQAYPLWETLVTPQAGFNYLDLAYIAQDRQEALYIDAIHYSGAFMRDIAEEIAAKIPYMMDEPTRRSLGLPRIGEPILRFGNAWELMAWDSPTDGLRACQSATMNTWWRPVPQASSSPARDAYLSLVLQNEDGLLLKKEVLLARLNDSADEQRLYPLAITLDIPCDARPAAYDVALAMSLCIPQGQEAACSPQDAFISAGGLGAYPYLTTLQLSGG